MMRVIRLEYVIAIFIMMTVLVCSVDANIKRADYDVAGPNIVKIVNGFSSHRPSYLMTLSSDRDVDVILRGGACCASLRVLARSSVSPKHIARIIESSLSDSEFKHDTIVWSRNADYSAARLLAGRKRFPKLSGNTTFPIGRVLDSLKRAGFKPRAIFIKPYYLSMKPNSCRLVAYGKHMAGYYSVPPTDPKLCLHMYASIPCPRLLYTVSMFLILPLSWMLIAVCPVILEKRNLKVKRIWLSLAMAAALCAGINIHMRIFDHSFDDSLIQNLGDIWFGDPATSRIIVVFLLIFSAMSCIYPGLIIRRVNKRLYGSFEYSYRIEMSTRERGIRVVMYSLVIAMVILGLFLMLLCADIASMYHLNYYIPLLAGLIFCILGPVAILRIFRIWLAPYIGMTYDPELTRRAEVIAKAMGTSNPTVSVSEGTAAKQLPIAMLRLRGRVVLSRFLVELLSPEEMDFILAHEIAHLKYRHIKRKLAFSSIGLLSILSPVLIGVIYQIGSLLTFFSICFFLFGLAALFIGSAYTKLLELEADHAALIATCDYDAARSALTNIAKHSLMPQLHEMDTFTHPGMSKRLIALRRTADEMGYSSPVSDLQPDQ